MLLILSSCGNSQNPSDGKSGTDNNIMDTETSTENEVVDGIIDGIEEISENDKEFYAIRVGQDYIEICIKEDAILGNEIYTQYGSFYPELEEGQIAKITADVIIKTGGEDGFMNNIFIGDIKSTQVISHKEFADDIGIRDASDNNFDSNNHLLKFQDMNTFYLLVLNKGDIYVYKDEELMGDFDLDDIKNEDHPTVFFDMLSDDQADGADSTNDDQAESAESIDVDQSGSSEDTNNDDEKNEYIENSDNQIEKVQVDGYYQISQIDARTMMDSEENYIILDVRSEEEYEESHILSYKDNDVIEAVCIPLPQIKEYEEEGAGNTVEGLSDKNQLIFVYCRTGRRSKAAAKVLADLGYTNIYEIGGITTWGDPTGDWNKTGEDYD